MITKIPLRYQSASENVPKISVKDHQLNRGMSLPFTPAMDNASDEPAVFSENVKTLRGSMSLTQEAFADQADIKLPTVKKWERPGIHRISLSNFKKMMDAFSMSKAELIQRLCTRPPSSQADIDRGRQSNRKAAKKSGRLEP